MIRLQSSFAIPGCWLWTSHQVFSLSLDWGHTCRTPSLPAFAEVSRTFTWFIGWIATRQACCCWPEESRVFGVAASCSHLEASESSIWLMWKGRSWVVDASTPRWPV